MPFLQFGLSLLIGKQYIMATHDIVGTYGRWTRGGPRRGILFSRIGLATKTDRAIDLSCRACGAGAWALGLDSRLGTPASLPFSTPNLQLILRVVAELGILRVVAELQNS